MELPSTNQRVAQNTSPVINHQIQERTRHSIEYYQANPALINERLLELDKEWDIERVLETNASSLIVTGSALGFIKSKLFFLVPLVIGGFLLQHALQGWCPPLPILRKLGYRTTSEIQEERTALENIARRQRQKHH